MAQYNPFSLYIDFPPELNNPKSKINKTKSSAQPIFALKNCNVKKSARSISSCPIEAKRAYSSLNPTIPHKKLNETPQFFQSLQKRKKRILNSLQKNSFAQYQTYIQGQISNSKQTQGIRSDYLLNYPVSNSQSSEIEHSKNIHLPHAIGPHININLQMILKRRRPSDPLSTNRHNYLISSAKRKIFGPQLETLI